MNNEQWGNIELPGLSDEKLLKTNWNHFTAMQKLAKDPKWLQIIRDTAKKWSNDPKWQQEQIERIERRNNNDIWRKNVGDASVKTHGRCCIVPWGIFPSVQQAGLFRDQQRGTKCGVTVTCRNLKKETPGYYYISQEEYIMLTGKDL